MAYNRESYIKDSTVTFMGNKNSQCNRIAKEN